MNTRCGLVISLCFSLSTQLFAQCNDWDNLISGERIFINDSERDQYGNLYVSGSFGSQYLDIGNVHLENAGNAANGDLSYFLIKFDKNFEALWGKASGIHAAGHNVEIDSKGDVIIAGYFYDWASFDCINLVSADGRADTFVAKISSNGMVYWAIQSKAGNDDYEHDLAITSEDNIVVGGIYLGGPIFNQTVPAFGGYDFYVIQFDPNGSVQWAKSMGGPADVSYDYLESVAIDSHDNVVITGWHGTDELHIDNFILPASNPSENFFLAKIDPHGTTLWAKNTDGAPDSGYDVDVDADDNIFVTGRFYEGTYAHDELPLASSGDADIFITKYSAGGEALHVARFGGTRFESPNHIKVDNNGNVIVVGYFYSTDFYFGSTFVTKPEFQNDLFVIVLDPQLNPICMKRTSGDGENYAYSLEVDAANNILIVVDEILGYTTHFDNKYILNGNDHPSMFVTIGNADNFEPGINTPFSFTVSLGADKVLCPGTTFELAAGNFCSATYKWNTGSTSSKINASLEGIYWVDVTVNGTTVRDSVRIDFEFEDIHLGPDVLICPGENVSLHGDISCDASYLWSNGETTESITVITPGTYWVEVRSGSYVERDTIVISFKDLPIVDLGDDTELCEDDAIVLDALQGHAAQYLWNTGETQPTKTVTTPGKYWVRVTSECISVADTITISSPAAISFTLGEDRQICAGESLILSPDLDGNFDYLWSDGTTARDRIITTSGDYVLTISSACQSTTDAIRIHVITPAELKIPNVVTANPEHDNDNNTFIVPDDLRGSHITIFNRWGNIIANDFNYQNTWPEHTAPAGVYFYQIHGICGSGPLKGAIHLLH